MSYFQNFGYKIGLCNLMIENISGRTGNVGYKVGVCNLRLRHLTWFFGNLGYNLGLCNLIDGHFVSGTEPLMAMPLSNHGEPEACKRLAGGEARNEREPPD